VGELVNEVPGKAAADVKAGIAAIAFRKCAVLWLRLVGLEIFEVACGIN
jgi:hypothetical protein